MEKTQRSWQNSLCKYYDERKLADIDHLPESTKEECLDFKVLFL